MKFIAVLLCFSLLVSCSWSVTRITNKRVVEFYVGDVRIGYWLALDSSNYLTAAHVLKFCHPSNCRVDGRKIWSKAIYLHGDMSIVGEGFNSENIWFSWVTSWESLYILRPENWRIKKYDAKVSAVNIDYIAYDMFLSGSYLTWGIEISIPFQKGDSGLPVWNNFGQLVGIMSSTDGETGKSYIAR